MGGDIDETVEVEGRNSDGFIHNVDTPASSLKQRSSSDALRRPQYWSFKQLCKQILNREWVET